MTEVFTLAVVGSPFGLKGFVKARSLSGEIAHIAALKNVNLKLGDTQKSFLIEEIMSVGSGKSGDFLVKFRGIDSPEAAAALRGAQFVADRREAAPLKNGEYYVEDLKGLAVTVPGSGRAAGCGNDEILGHITDILEGGGGDLAEIRLLSGEKKMVPFRKEFFGGISVENGWAELLERWILD